jgi:drug/metabolite transporter (DMT)-like permease
MPALRLFLLTAVVMLSFAGNSVLNRLGVGSGAIGAVDFAVVRVVAGAALLMLLVGGRSLVSGVPVWPGARGRLAGVVTLTVYLFGFSLAYGALDAGTGALVLFGAVQVTLFAAALWLGERVPPERLAGAACAMAGLAVLLAPGMGAPASLLHVGLMVAAGVGWGGYALAARGTGDPLGATAWNFALAVPPALLLLALLPRGAAPSAKGLGLAALSGAVTSGLGYALWYRVLPALGPSRAGVAQLTVPLIAAAGGAALIGEMVGLRFALAAGLVIGGVVLGMRR